MQQQNQIIENMPFADYQAIDAVNMSSLKHIARSPAYYKWKLTQPDKQTDAMAIGSAVHCAVLEPLAFTDRYCSFGGRRAGENWTDFVEANPDKTILKLPDFDRVMQINNAVMGHELSKQILTNPTNKTEVVIVWTDPSTGILCKARLDLVSDDCISDLKTAADPTTWAFCKSAASYHYYTQFAMYANGWQVVTGDRLPVKVIAVGSQAPHEVVVYNVPGEPLNHGQDEYRAMLEMLHQCQKNDEWAEYCQSEPIDMVVPGWCLPFGADTDSPDPFGGI